MMKYGLENMGTSNIMQIKQVVFRNIYVYAYVYVYVTTINEKGDHGFEREHRRI